MWRALRSMKDRSVDFVVPYADDTVQARYVRRREESFGACLSSYTGSTACHFCEASKVTNEPVTVTGYLEQAVWLLRHYDAEADDEGHAETVYFSWMARGDALINPHFVDDGFTLSTCLAGLARKHGLRSRFNISTVMPKAFEGSLVETFHGLPFDFAYPLYSADEKMRRRRFPRASPLRESLRLLTEWQQNEKREIILQWTLVPGENDAPACVHAICDAVAESGMQAQIHLMPYHGPVEILAIIEDRLAPTCKLDRVALCVGCGKTPVEIKR